LPQTDPRARFRADTIKLSAKEVATLLSPYGSSATISFMLENRSGIGLGLGIRRDATSAGPCVGDEKSASAFSLLRADEIQRLTQSPNPAQSLRWFPAGAKVVSTVVLSCYSSLRSLAALKNADITISFVVANGNNVMVIPLSAQGIPVRVVQQGGAVLGGGGLGPGQVLEVPTIRFGN
jgi:hypothetical protein